MVDSRDGSDEKTFIKAYDEIETAPQPTRGSEAYPLLEIIQGPKQGAWFTVAYQKEITLGRAATNSIILDDNSVSRSHSVVQASGQGFTVRDIGSRNGTFVNDKKIQGEVLLKHRDTIKIGIYTLRYMAKPLEEAVAYREESTPRVDEGTPTDMMMPPIEEETGAEAAPSVEPKVEGTIREDVQKIMSEEAPVPPKSPIPIQAKAPSPQRKALGTLLAIVLLLGVAAYGAYRMGIFDSLIASKAPEKGKKKTDAKAPEGKPVEGKVVSPETPTSTGDEIPIFIEVDSAPIQGKVFYKGRELGQTPFKINLQVPPGKPQELSAEFTLDKLGTKFASKESFEVKAQDEVAQVHFKPKLGSLNIKALPKDGQLYLEGKFDGEQNPAKVVQLTEINFNEPIYLPYGTYAAEIKVPETLPGSQSSHPVTRYRREFALADQKVEFIVDASDASLQTFPAKITTEPAGAELLVDGKSMGPTPFEGNLPMGRHTLVLKREGFNDFEKEISMEINTPYVVSFNLETSPAGVLVNKGREFIKKGMYNEAIEQLAEALKHSPDPTETSQIHMLLGEAFLGYKTYDQALAYYAKAAEVPEYAPRAKLGMAEAQAGLGQKDQALINIIDVVLNTKDPKLQAQAQEVYKRVSPMKSLLYVTSDPKGAQLTINGNPINQTTPVILSDLMVGSYRLAVSKAGFKSYETRVNMPVAAIKPVVVKLLPEQ